MLTGDPAATVIDVAEGDVVRSATVKHDLLFVARQFLPGGFQGETIVVGHGLALIEIVNAAPIPALDDAFGQRQLWMADQLFGIEHLLNAQAVAAGAGASWIVERVHARLSLGGGTTAYGAGIAWRVRNVFGFAVYDVHHADAVGQAEGSLK